MAIPSTTYDIATATNPSSSLTDFTFMIDLSRMSTAWWAEVDTSDGTRGRAAKNDGTTELATDWIDFDDSGETGWLRVQWSGTLASSGTQIIRVYPPNTGNTAYGVSDTYGQYNAYNSSWGGYWPLMADANDRTGTQNNGITNGGMTIGGVTGKVGNASHFDGADDWVELSPVLTGGDSDYELELWHKGTDTLNQYMGQGWSSNGGSRFLWMHQNTNYQTNGTGQITASTSDDIDGTWRCLGVSDSDLFIDSLSVETGSNTISSVTYDNAGIGSFNRGGSLYQPTLGDIQEAKVFDSQRSTTERALEFNQVDDNATFWGTWTNVPVGGTTYEIDLDTGVFTLTGQALDLLKNSLVSLDTGTFTLTGLDVDLVYTPFTIDYQIDLDTGVFTLTGEDITLLKDSVLDLDTGTFILDGKSVSLVYSGDLPTQGGKSPRKGKRRRYPREVQTWEILKEIFWGT